MITVDNNIDPFNLFIKHLNCNNNLIESINNKKLHLFGLLYDHENEKKSLLLAMTVSLLYISYTRYERGLLKTID